MYPASQKPISQTKCQTVKQTTSQWKEKMTEGVFRVSIEFWFNCTLHMQYSQVQSVEIMLVHHNYTFGNNIVHMSIYY